MCEYTCVCVVVLGRLDQHNRRISRFVNFSDSNCMYCIPDLQSAWGSMGYAKSMVSDVVFTIILRIEATRFKNASV